jgi:hypothetical protein
MTDKDLSKSQVDKPAKADSFDLVFRGAIAPGSNIEEVKQRVAASFNLDSVAADQLFSGSAVRLKRGVDSTTAERILQRLNDAGAIAKIAPSLSQPESQEQDSSQAKGQAKSQAKSQDLLSLAPLGSNFVDKDEKLEGQSAETKKRLLLSLDHLSLEPIGTDMVKQAEAPVIKAPAVDTSKFSLE